jgi:hypothetical protein
MSDVEVSSEPIATPEGDPLFVIRFFMDANGELDAHANGNLNDPYVNAMMASALGDIARYIADFSGNTSNARTLN